MIRSRALYTALLYLLLPRVLLRLWLRGRKEHGYRRHIGERFARFAGPRLQRCVWIHAVSVGETRAAQPIVERLLARHPDRAVLLTHMTPTGRQTGIELFGERVARCYLPYDFPAAAERFLAHFDPAFGLIMETEIWPNLIHACRRRGIRVHLVNARLSEKSYRGYARLGPIVEDALNALTGIAAQTEADAHRLRLLGAGNARVTGNVKFDIAPAPALVERGQGWRAAIGRDRPVFLAASTRDGEEALLLDALNEIRVPDLLTVIVPRHPQRFDEVARLIAERGVVYCRRSVDSLPDARTRVWLGDSMGEMAAYLAACDVAFIGGSLRPFGAHNLVEACALGKPVVIGPSVFNFQEAVELGVAAGGVLQVANAAGVASQVTALLTDRDRARIIGDAGAAFARAHRGAVDRLFDFLQLA